MIPPNAEELIIARQARLQELTALLLAETPPTTEQINEFWPNADETLGTSLYLPTKANRQNT